MIFHSYVSLPKGIICDGLTKCLFLVLLINRYSLRAASYCAFQTMTDPNWLVVSNPLKPHISQLGLLFPIYGKIKSSKPPLYPTLSEALPGSRRWQPSFSCSLITTNPHPCKLVCFGRKGQILDGLGRPVYTFGTVHEEPTVNPLKSFFWPWQSNATRM